MELLKQPQYNPWPLHHQVMLIYAGTRGLMDKVEVAGHQPLESGIRSLHGYGLFGSLSHQLATGNWTDEIEERCRQGIEDFNKDWSS